MYLKHETFLKFVVVSVCVFNVWPKTTLLFLGPETPKFWTPLESIRMGQKDWVVQPEMAES